LYDTRLTNHVNVFSYIQSHVALGGLGALKLMLNPTIPIHIGI